MPGRAIDLTVIYVPKTRQSSSLGRQSAESNALWQMKLELKPLHEGPARRCRRVTWRLQETVFAKRASGPAELGQLTSTQLWRNERDYAKRNALTAQGCRQGEPLVAQV